MKKQLSPDNVIRLFDTMLGELGYEHGVDYQVDHLRGIHSGKPTVHLVIYNEGEQS